ncbi:TAM41 protein, partial [Fregetta grallaria]|nr:TAM41 protein [Fregetta grallaria]
MALPVLSSSGVKFRRVLAHFPQELSLAFAYGSGVFRQAGASPGHGENNMLDFVFAVDDSVTWHMMNLLKNRSHYSFLKVFGPKQISSIQSYGAGIYYNTLVPCNGRVSMSSLRKLKHLKKTETHNRQVFLGELFLKSIVGHLVNQADFICLMFYNNTFLYSVLTEDLLFIPVYFHIRGDFRMVIGEDRSKVQNIVKPNVPHFQKLYSNILQDCPQVVYKHHLGRLEASIDKSPEGQFTQLMALPRTLQQKITSLVDPPGKNRDVEEILLQVAHDPDCGFVVHQG